MPRLITLVVVLLAHLPALPAQELVWRNRTSPPTSQPLRAVVSTPGLFLALGDRGTLLTSPDGSGWTARALPQPNHLTAAAAGNALYLVTDDRGYVYSSPDSATWSVASEPPAGTSAYSSPIPTALAFGNGVFVRALASKGISYSTNGKTWTLAKTDSGDPFSSFSAPSYPTALYGRLVFRSGSFYLLSGNQFLTSTNGATWHATSVTDGPAFTTELAIGPGRFVIARGDTGKTSTVTVGGTVTATYTGGGYLTSADGITWTSLTSPNLEAVNFVNGRFYAREAVTLAALTSVDGLTWTPATTDAAGRFPLTAVHDGLRYVTLSGERLYTSTDAATWVLRQTVSPLTVPSNVAFGRGTYVAGGVRSSDGLTWSADGFVPPTADYALRIVFCHDRFFFFETTARTAPPATPRSVFISLDGHTRVQTLTMPTTSGGFLDVAYGKGRFVLFSTSGTYTSTDGQNWVLASTDTGGDNVAFGAGLFVAVSSQSIKTSPDGLIWTTRATITPYPPGSGPYPILSYSGVTYARDRFVVLYQYVGKVIEGTGAAPMMSLDGLTWTMGSSRFGVSPSAPTFIDGVFALSAGGTSYGTVNDRYLHLSYDGLSWNAIRVPFSLGSITGANGTLVAADDTSGTAAINLYQTILPSATPPVITATNLRPVTLTRSQSGNFSVTAQSTGPLSYQWRRNGVPIAGATSSSYVVTPATGASGLYDVVITGPGGSLVSPAAIVTLADSWLANVSSRAYVGTGEDVLIQGFVVRSSDATFSLLARAIGPSLASFGLTDVLADPNLVLARQAGGTVLDRNDNWVSNNRYTTPTLRSAFQRVGAFDLPEGSADAALITTLGDGGYTFAVSGANGGSGTALSELYDASYLGSSATAGRLVNLSARARAGTGDRTLILGFVIAGDRPLTLLLRGVGPSLSGHGIASPLANPKITLYNSAGREIDNNDTWHHAANLAALRTATTTVGAFPLTENSNDAAMLVTLAPGLYTLVINSQDSTSGVALAEIYEVQE